MTTSAPSRIFDIRESGEVPHEARFEPPCQCEICAPQFLSLETQSKPGYGYSWKLTDKAAQRMVEGQISRIQEHRQSLMNCIRSNGNEILRLWETGIGNRQAYLRASKVKIPADNWTRASTWYARDMGDKRLCALREWQKNGNMWLAPHLSLESLATQSSNFLAFLHNRTQYPLEQWFAYTNEQISRGWVVNVFRTHISATCMIIRGERFGQVIPWNEEAVHLGDAISLSRAVLVLQALLHNLYVAQRIIAQIILDIDSAVPPASEKWTTAIARGFKVAEDRPLWSNPPPSFCVDPHLSLDFDLLIQTAQARREAKEDHMTLMQSSLEYIRESYSQLVAGSASLHTDDGQPFMKAAIFNRYVMFAFDDQNRWRWIQEECEAVQRISIDQPKRIEQALACLDLLLDNQLGQSMLHLRSILKHHPRFQESSWEKLLRAQIENPHFDRQVFLQDRLEWCVGAILISRARWQNFMPLPGIDCAIASGMLTDYLSNNEADRSCFDEKIAGVLSDIASLDLMLQNVRSFRGGVRRMTDGAPLTAQNQKEIEQLTTQCPDLDTSLRYQPAKVMMVLKDLLEPLCIYTNGEQIPDREKWIVMGKLMMILEDEECKNEDEAKGVLNEYWHMFYRIEKEFIGKLGFSKRETDIQLSTLLHSYNAHEATITGSALGQDGTSSPLKVAKSTHTASKKKKRNKKKRKGGKKKGAPGRGRKNKSLPERRVRSINGSESLDQESRDPEEGSEQGESEGTDTEVETGEQLVEDALPGISDRASEVAEGELFEKQDEVDVEKEVLSHTPPPPSPPSPSPSPSPPSPPGPRYLVSKKTLDFVHDMFTTGGKGHRTWKEFLVAMNDIGFVITQHCGSETRFQIAAEDFDKGSVGGKRTIDFHKIHWNDSKLHRRELRRMGYRLSSRWGWDLNCFGLRPKS